MNNLFSKSGDLLLRFVLLAGDDATSRELAAAAIIAAVKKQQPGAEMHRYSAEDTPFDEFCERVITPSLLSPLRVFVIPDVHLLDDKELGQLSGLFGYDAADALVVMETEKLKGGKKSRDAALSKKYAMWLDAFEEHAEKSPERFLIETFPRPPDYKMAEWVEAQAPHLFGRRITRNDAEHLVDLAGADTAVLYSELQKIDLFLEPKAAISRDVIDNVVGATRQAATFELAQALGEKNMARALEIIESMYTGSVYLPPYIGAIFRHFWSLFRIFQFTKANPGALRKYRNGGRQPQNDAALEIGVGAGILAESQAARLFPVMIKPRMIKQALSFGPEQYKRIFSLLAEFDTGIKTGRYDDSKAGFQLICYRIAKGDLQ
jgi:DNA polymerase III delta subunit